MLEALTYCNTVFFTIEELACKHCGQGKLAPGFGIKLLEFRIALDELMHLNSACRCKEHNTNEGGHLRSLHVYDEPHWPTEGTCAIDVRTHGMLEGYRGRIIDLARKLGWSIGYGRNFIHLDRRTDYTSLPRAEFQY